MKEIKTLGELRELINRFDKLSDDTKVVLTNRFQEFVLSRSCIYDGEDNALIFECEQQGSVLQGKHRVLG